MSAAPLILGLDAMRTRFELVLHGENPVRLRAAGEAALAEIRDCDRRLSRFRPDSWIARLNREAGLHPCPVPAELMELLQLCAQVHENSEGAFDPTFRAAPPSTGSDSESSTAGFSQVHLDPDQQTVTYAHPGLNLDLGGVAKGWALDRACEVLLEAGVECALIHGGTSSSRALPNPPPQPAGARGWRIALEDRASIELQDRALALSSNAERGHVVDPGSGHAVVAGGLAAVCAANAALADAWSTALLVQHPDTFSWKSIP